MENKCNKTPNTNNKYLDHVYCHPTESKSYIRANNNIVSGGGGGGGATSATNADYLALLKENKQLRAMLILHLDLIQAQSDQLQIKDKQLATQNEELDGLRARSQQLETQVLELQKQLQRHIKRTANSPPPLAKIQRQTEPILTNAAPSATSSTSGTKNIIGECNGKLISKIILHRVSLADHSPNSTTTGTSDTTSEADDSTASKTQHEHDEHDDEPCEEEDDGDIEEAGETTGNTTEDSNDVVAISSKPFAHQRNSPVLVSRGAKPFHQIAVSMDNTVKAPIQPVATIGTTLSLTAALPPTVATTAAATPVQVCVTPSTPSRGKQMPLMLWHAPDLQSDESASCESLGELSDQRSMVASPVSPKVENKSKKGKNNTTTVSLRSRTQTQQRQNKTRRCAYISTAQMYCTRAWEDEEVIADGYEFMKEEAEALKADAPMLEIPKWTEHELTVSYCIEGTENLADETFYKRHDKLELAERRRKKWDVQQIREQRRIEKLKRRHCKDEIQVPPDQQPLLSFYPQADTVQTICFTSDLPVQAFGELVPKINALHEFDLPWLETLTTGRMPGSGTTGSVITLAQTHAAASSHTSLAQGQQQLMNSTFVFVKKRKRQQSGTTSGGTTARQRSALRKAAAAAAAAITATASASIAATVTPEASTTTTTTPIITQQATVEPTTTSSLSLTSSTTTDVISVVPTAANDATITEDANPK